MLLSTVVRADAAVTTLTCSSLTSLVSTSSSSSTSSHLGHAQVSSVKYGCNTCSRNYVITNTGWIYFVWRSEIFLYLLLNLMLEWWTMISEILTDDKGSLRQAIVICIVKHVITVDNTGHCLTVSADTNNIIWLSNNINLAATINCDSMIVSSVQQACKLCLVHYSPSKRYWFCYLNPVSSI